MEESKLRDWHFHMPQNPKMSFAFKGKVATMKLNEDETKIIFEGDIDIFFKVLEEDSIGFLSALKEKWFQKGMDAAESAKSPPGLNQTIEGR